LGAAPSPCLGREGTGVDGAGNAVQVGIREEKFIRHSVLSSSAGPRMSFVITITFGDRMAYQQQYPAQNIQPSAVPLWAPLYGATFQDAVRRFWKKYSVFSGRASRSEYWWWALVSIVVSIVLQILIASGTAGATATASGTVTSAPGPGLFIGGILAVVWGLATIVPSLALVARRLHDVNLSGWLMLVALVPFLGGLALLVMTILPPNPAGQRFDQPGSI
jgi:uncharacterized membrane protein YhaH (DUF805 family)